MAHHRPAVTIEDTGRRREDEDTARPQAPAGCALDKLRWIARDNPPTPPTAQFPNWVIIRRQWSQNSVKKFSKSSMVNFWLKVQRRCDPCRSSALPVPGHGKGRHQAEGTGPSAHAAGPGGPEGRSGPHTASLHGGRLRMIHWGRRDFKGPLPGTLVKTTHTEPKIHQKGVRNGKHLQQKIESVECTDGMGRRNTPHLGGGEGIP